MLCLSICLQLTSYVLAFISYLVQGEKLTISAGGHIKVGRQTREVYWGNQNNGDKQPAPISGATIIFWCGPCLLVRSLSRCGLVRPPSHDAAVIS